MRIAIGADHGGFELKEKIIQYLKSKGHIVKDFGAYSIESCDYPKYGFFVALAVAGKKYSRGVLICKSGIGMSIVANRVRGIRAALVNDVDSAKFSREHNDSNIIVFGSRATDIRKAKRMLEVWLTTKHLSGRHLRRVRQIDEMSSGN